MMHRLVCVALLSLLMAPGVWAEIPGPNGERGVRPPDVPVDDGRPKPLPRLLIVHDANEPTARLVLPANATAERKTEEARPAQAAAFPLFGLALAGSLIGGGLWLTRMPRAKWLLAAILPLGAIGLAGFVVAQPARPAPGRRVIETMKVRITRTNIGSDYHLILPKR